LNGPSRVLNTAVRRPDRTTAYHYPNLI
jgi:hypothetical protein